MSLADDEPYQISYEPAPGLLKVTRKGMWTDEVFDRYERDLRRMVRRILDDRANYLSLVDLRGHAVQTQSITKRFEGLLQDASLAPDMVAIVADQSLIRLQAARLARANQRVFASVEDARAWLLGCGKYDRHSG